MRSTALCLLCALLAFACDDDDDDRDPTPAAADATAADAADPDAAADAMTTDPDAADPDAAADAMTTDPDAEPADATPDAMTADPDAAVICTPGVEVTLANPALPPEMAGHYLEAFDCAREEGGAWFGGVDFAHCFRKNDASTWRIWNTGCGWEFGRLEPRGGRPGDPLEWQRYARTYTGQCAAIPPAQLDTRALTTATFYDGFGQLLPGVEATYDDCAP